MNTEAWENTDMLGQWKWNVDLDPSRLVQELPSQAKAICIEILEFRYILNTHIPYIMEKCYSVKIVIE